MSDEIHAFLYLCNYWEMEVSVHTCTNVYSSDLCYSHLEFQSCDHLNKWRLRQGRMLITTLDGQCYVNV